MLELITLDEAQRHLGQTFDHDDADLIVKVLASSKMVLDHIGGDETTYATPEEVPVDVKLAVMLLLGYYDENRAGETWRDGMPAAVVSLLSSYHDPVTQ